MVIYSANAGTIISLYDSPVGSKKDDFTIIKVKKDIRDVPEKIPTFEKSFSNEVLDVHFDKDEGWMGIGWFANGLDGKLSLVKVKSQ